MWNTWAEVSTLWIFQSSPQAFQSKLSLMMRYDASPGHGVNGLITGLTWTGQEKSVIPRLEKGRRARGQGEEKNCLCKEISRHCVCVLEWVALLDKEWGVGRITEVGSRIKWMDGCRPPSPPQSILTHTKSWIERKWFALLLFFLRGEGWCFGSVFQVWISVAVASYCLVSVVCCLVITFFYFF